MRILTRIILFISAFIWQTCNGDQDYILNTSTCKIPDLEPFNEEAIHFIEPLSYYSCNESELLSYVEKKDDQAVLYLREDLMSTYESKNISCCYSYVNRNGSEEEPDVGFSESECLPFNQSVVLTQETVKVTCTGNWSEYLYQNVHNPIILKKSVKSKIKNTTGTSQKLSVLFIVIDSISRLNFIRTMNQTYTYLMENNFIPMKGYTKIADNTFPNFAALLTGLNAKGLRKKCKAQKIGGMDACPLIWYDYRKKGYITAYAEDDSFITTFNFRKKGFKNPPTDYYFKPYIEASESLGVKYSYYMRYCTGPETAGERILNLAKDFSTTFVNQSTFGIFWMNTFSHDYVNAPYQMDEKMKDFFVELKTSGVLDEKIVVVLSDHGIRFGDILTTQSGWLEERMPLNIISVPEKFQEKFPEEYRNLQENSNKLTSTHDLYTTLQHILQLSKTNYTGHQSEACPNCRSLFKKIPKNRTCKQAGIPVEWCTCMGHFEPIGNTTDHVKNATIIILEKINTDIQIYESFEQFELDYVVFASISESLSGDDVKYLYVVINTTPLSTVFTTVKFRDYVSVNSTFYFRQLA